MAYNVKRGDREYVAAFEGDRKVFAASGDGLVRGELEAAYDLAEDPNHRSTRDRMLEALNRWRDRRNR